MNRSSRWPWIIPGAIGLGCTGLCAAIVLAVWAMPELALFFQREASPKVGSPAPDFALRTLDGKTVQLSQFRGHPVMLTFAASWCPDCQKEAPLLESIHQEHPELMVVLIDDKESLEVVRGFASGFRMTHLILLDTSGAVSNQYRIYAIPTTYFIDSEGVIRGLVIDSVTPEYAAQMLPGIGVAP